jgi:hypothetical protein
MRFLGILIDPNSLKDRYEPLFIPLMNDNEFEMPSFSKYLEKQVFKAWKKARIE